MAKRFIFFTHVGLKPTKQDPSMLDIPAWGLVVWGLTKFHTGLTRPMHMAVIIQAYY